MARRKSDGAGRHGAQLDVGRCGERRSHTCLRSEERAQVRLHMARCATETSSQGRERSRSTISRTRAAKSAGTPQKRPLHLAAKDMLAKRKEIVLPEVAVKRLLRVSENRGRTATALRDRVGGGGAENWIDHPGRDRRRERTPASRRSDRHTRSGRRQIGENQGTRPIVPRNRPLRRPAATSAAKSSRRLWSTAARRSAGSTTCERTKPATGYCPTPRCWRRWNAALLGTLTDARFRQGSGRGTHTPM